MTIKAPTSSEWKRELNKCKWCKLDFQKWQNPCKNAPKHNLYSFGSDEIKLVDHLLSTQRSQTVKEVIELLDKMELDGKAPTDDKWRLWKHIRNTIRERIADPYKPLNS